MVIIVLLLTFCCNIPSELKGVVIQCSFVFVQLVKDIRRLVDNGEFLANRHCKSSPVVKLIITLLLELITDHSREVRT